MNAVNWDLDMSAIVERLRPDRWKVLRMLPTTTNALQVTQQQFDVFIRRHAGLTPAFRPEDHSDMVESYIMVDPHGRFFQNRAAQAGYEYSAPIVSAGGSAAFQSIKWSPERFATRYQARPVGQAL